MPSCQGPPTFSQQITKNTKYLSHERPQGYFTLYTFCTFYILYPLAREACPVGTLYLFYALWR